LLLFIGRAPPRGLPAAFGADRRTAGRQGRQRVGGHGRFRCLPQSSL